MAQIQGGPAVPVSVVTGGKIKGGKAIPVYGYTSAPTDGRRAAAGPAHPVHVVSDAQLAAGTFTLEGGPALPMYVSPSGLSVVGDAAQPVYVVGGSLGGAPSSLLNALKLYLPLGETGSATRADSSGNSNHFTATGAPSNGTGKIGSALVSTSGKYLTRAYTSTLAMHTGNWTISLWYNLTTYAEGKMLYGQWSAAYTFALWFYQTFPSIVTSGTPGDIRYFDRMDAIAGDAGAWHHLLIWWDSDAGLLWVMRDNKNLKSFTQTAITTNTTDPISIGALGSGTNGFEGLLDEIAFWQRKLTASEMAYLYANGNANAYPFTSQAITQKQIVCDGDSLTEGYPKTTTWAQSYPGQLDTAYSGANAVRNVGVSGKAISQLLTDAATKFDWLYATVYAKNICVIWAGINDILLLNRTAAAIYADLVTYCQARQAVGWQVVICTLTPSQYSGQPVDTQTRIDTINTNIRNNYTDYADGLADLAAEANLSDPTNTTYFNADKLHLKDAGQAIVETTVKAVIDAL